MRIFDTITDENFTIYAAKHYDNCQCTDVEEFNDDLNRFRYLKRLFGRYHQQGDLQERLILNHLVVLFNIFGIEPTKRMLLFKVDEIHYSALKTFLVFLHYLKEDEMVEVPLDQTIVDKLRNI